MEILWHYIRFGAKFMEHFLLEANFFAEEDFVEHFSNEALLHGMIFHRENFLTD